MPGHKNSNAIGVGHGTIGIVRIDRNASISALCQLRWLAGREHGRTIPLADIAPGQVKTSVARGVQVSKPTESRDKSRDAEIFRCATLRKGVAYNPDFMPAPVKAYYDLIAARAEDLIQSARDAFPELPLIHFDFIVNGNINAFAFREADRYFIGMNTGTIYMLRLVIGRMLADPGLFPSIGDPAEEVSDVQPIKDYFPDAERMYMTNDLLTPRNAGRRAYATFLEDQALMFYVGHEITHIAHGHIDYLREKRGLSCYSEMSAVGADDTEARLERQCLEQDADRRSILARISSLRDQQAIPDYPGLPWASGDKTTERLIHDWMISISIVFR